MQVDLSRKSDTVTGPQERGIPKHHGRGQEPFAQHALRAVDISEEQVEQPCPLNQSCFEVRPLCR